MDGNSSNGQEIPHSHDHYTPHRKQQNCRGLGLGGITRLFSTAGLASKHTRIDRRLCSTLLVPGLINLAEGISFRQRWPESILESCILAPRCELACQAREAWQK